MKALLSFVLFLVSVMARANDTLQVNKHTDHVGIHWQVIYKLGVKAETVNWTSQWIPVYVTVQKQTGSRFTSISQPILSWFTPQQLSPITRDMDELYITAARKSTLHKLKEYKHPIRPYPQKATTDNLYFDDTKGKQ